MAQAQPGNLRVKRVSHNAIVIEWRGAPQISTYWISYYASPDGPTVQAGSTSRTSFTLEQLRDERQYVIFVDYSGGYMQITANTLKKPRVKKVITKPYVATCPLLPAGVSVTGYERHTHCQRVDAPGVGMLELVAQGVVDAVDVWGSVKTSVRVCFRNQGRLMFLDAASAPRSVSDLAAEAVDGMTCGTIDRAGTVVLLEGPTDATVAPRQEAPATDVAEPSAETAAAAEVVICRLVATAYLSLRAGPSVYYARLDVLPLGARLLAAARAGDWFLVEHEGQWGWASGAYLTKSAGCDAIGESNRVYLSLDDERAPVQEEAQDESIEAAEAASVEPGAYELVDCRLTAGDIINLRTEPGTEHNIEAEIPFRTQLLAEDRVGDWFKVKYEGIMGWVNIDYVFRRGACG